MSFRVCRVVLFTVWAGFFLAQMASAEFAAKAAAVRPLKVGDRAPAFIVSRADGGRYAFAGTHFRSRMSLSSIGADSVRTATCSSPTCVWSSHGSGLWLLVSLPGTPNGPTLLICRQAVHPMTDQNAVHGRAGDAQTVEAPQISGDPPRPKVIPLPKVKDF